MLTVPLIDAVTKVDTEVLYPGGRYPLGALTFYTHATYGPQFYRYVYNNSGSSIAANLGVMQENGTTRYEVALSTTGIAAQRIYGVTQWAIGAASYGWVLCSGIGSLASDGSTTADTPQLPAASGQFSDGTVGTPSIVAHAMETEDPAGAAGLFDAIVRFL